jgi:hypothetical protein
MSTTFSTMDLSAGKGERVSRTRSSCWCGQALDHVTGRHCPRCGRSASRWAGR